LSKRRSENKYSPFSVLSVASVANPHPRAKTYDYRTFAQPD